MLCRNTDLVGAITESTMRRRNGVWRFLIRRVGASTSRLLSCIPLGSLSAVLLCLLLTTTKFAYHLIKGLKNYSYLYLVIYIAPDGIKPLVY